MFFNFIKNLNPLIKTNKIIVRDLGILNYMDCFEMQKQIQNEIIQIKLNNRNKSIPKNTPNYLLFDENKLKQKGIQFHKTNRGGDITYHGPGQLVCYPILDMENFYTDIHRYLRDLEGIVIETLNFFGIKASGNTNETGVWLDVGNINERKICAMGIKVSRWVTMHGLALNINTDLSYFDGIIPCGITNKGVTSISNELNKKINVNDVKKVFIQKFSEKFNAITEF